MRPIHHLTLGLCLVLGACEQDPSPAAPVEPPAPPLAQEARDDPSPPPAPGEGVYYSIGRRSVVAQLYPHESWLPGELECGFRDLKSTIEHYTKQSLERDGVADAKVSVHFMEGEDGQVYVHISPDNETTQQYATVHPKFLDEHRGQQGLLGANACKAEGDQCWDRKPYDCRPWAFYLPLGLPMVNQRTVLYLNYPPTISLTDQDYLTNFTMCRWNRVLGAAGAVDPYAFDTMVDARPIAATGRGQTRYLPNDREYFDNSEDPEKGHYLTPMLQFVTNPSEAEIDTTVPVAALGGEARKSWGRIINLSEPPLAMEVGTASLGGRGAETPWFAGNHPSYAAQLECPGTPIDGRDEERSPHDPEVDEILDELALRPTLGDIVKQDFVTACWLRVMSSGTPPKPERARDICKARWMDNPPPENRQALCVQQKLDHYTRDRVCASWVDAWNYCSANDQDACATASCEYDPRAVKTPAPPPSERPWGWAFTCNYYRHIY